LCLSSGFLVGQGPWLPPPLPLPPPPQVAFAPPCSSCPVTLCEFARTFHPEPGTYHVLIIHPVKRCPVPVCFTLPPGCPSVHLGKRELVFDYGCQAVTIQFKVLFGRVKVSYD
ncbi:MAG: hypothetical protein JO112_06665, partial [Planctomycetes bacterium]|nr:hypothetical protein [Planctomycetota bacterium]